MGVLPRLKAFLTEGNRDELLTRARSLFAASIVRDDANRPSEGEDFFDDLGAFSPLVEVAFVEAVESGDVCAEGVIVLRVAIPLLTDGPDARGSCRSNAGSWFA